MARGAVPRLASRDEPRPDTSLPPYARKTGAQYDGRLVLCAPEPPRQRYLYPADGAARDAASIPLPDRVWPDASHAASGARPRVLAPSPAHQAAPAAASHRSPAAPDTPAAYPTSCYPYACTWDE